MTLGAIQKAGGRWRTNLGMLVSLVVDGYGLRRKYRFDRGRDSEVWYGAAKRTGARVQSKDLDVVRLEQRLITAKPGESSILVVVRGPIGCLVDPCKPW